MEEGEKVKRIVELAKERNIDFKPSAEARQHLADYCDRKGIINPLTGVQGQAINVAPVYSPPLPPPFNPHNDGQPPAFLPPGGGGGGYPLPNPHQAMPGYSMPPPFQPQAQPDFMSSASSGFNIGGGLPPYQPMPGAPVQYNYQQYDPNADP